MHHFDPVYYSRMAGSLGDKSAIIKHLVPGLTIDVGAGGGELGQAIAEVTGNEVVGIDPFPHPDAHISVIEGFADEIILRVSNIVASSVMHEVFSYGNRDQNVHSLANVEKTFSHFAKSLHVGGRLIIRDGVAPKDAQNHGSVLFSDDRFPAYFDKFINIFPTVTDLTRNGMRLSGTIHYLAEFILKYNWGEASLDREGKEFYTVMHSEVYESYAAAYGMRLLRMEKYIQEGYVHHLSQKIHSMTFEFPWTNALYVFEKI